MRAVTKSLVALLLCLSVGSAWADLTGKVVAVTDGDTLTVLDSDQRQIKVRLAQIDSPEKKQPYGQTAKQSLAALCFGVVAKIHPAARDRYGRTVAQVQCRGLDVNREQVRLGMAWVYDKYVEDRTLYEDQAQARAAKRGLWALPRPVAPWEWRKARRSEG